jgi:hypothetical protein
LYDPLTEHAATFPAWTGGRSFQRWLRRWSRRLGIELPLTRERGHRVFETELALVVAGGLLAVFLLVQGDRFLRRYARWWLGRTAAAGQRTKAPAFYRRLERLLIRAGLSRREGQTAQELAAVAEQRLAGSNGRPGVAKLPARIVEAYYRVRFGGGRLDRQESEAIEHALVALGPAFKQAKRHRNRQ